MKPLAIDLFCGLGGWTEGLLAAGYDVIGFDTERHRYAARALPEADGVKATTAGVDFGVSSIGKDSRHRSFNYANECAVRDAPLTGGRVEYPATLVIQDVLTLHGAQFRDAALIVASPPCQAYSYRAMPWSRAKALPPPDNALFDACFRIQREASEAAGRRIPLIVENVRGAQKWVGRARWNFGSFYLWGDVPALMPLTLAIKKTGHDWSRFAKTGEKSPQWNEGSGHKIGGGAKVPGIGWTGFADTDGVSWRNREAAIKVGGGADGWFGENSSLMRQHSSGSSARKAASAMIAKIPLALSTHIARVYLP